MDRKRLGSTELSITQLGLGTWAIGGGGWAFGWGPQDDERSIETILAALEQGINWVDTAPIYGLGHSEEIVGQALKQWQGEAPYVFTKLGMQWDQPAGVRPELIPANIEREIDDSLRRLDVDVIDLMQIHWPVPDDRVEASWEAMLRAREAGKVRYVGVCNFDRGQLERIAAIEAPASNQPPFNLLQQQILDETAPWCVEHRVGLIPYSPILSGLLTGRFDRDRVASLPEDDWRRNLPLWQGEAMDRFLRLTSQLSEIADSLGTTMSNLAIAWTLTAEAVTAPIVGARKPEQIRETVAAASLKLDEDVLARIDAALDEFGTRTLKLYG